MTVEEMRWDLSQMVEDTNPDAVKRALEAALEDVKQFREKYYGKIESLDASGLKELLEESDRLKLKHESVFDYCQLLYTANALDDTAKQLFDAARNAEMKMGQMVAFLEIELGKLLSKKPELVKDPILVEYKHFLERIVRRIPHMLSEREEQLIITKDLNGIDAWSRLQGDWLSTRTFEIEIDGEKKVMPYGEIIGLYQHPDRDVRKRANQVVYEGLGKDEIIWASAIRAVCSDHVQMCEWRKYKSPMESSLIANDVDQETIDSLMRTIEKNVDLYREYLRLKAKLMDLPKLGNWDIVAPLPNAPDMQFKWEEARQEVIQSYKSFDEEVGAWVEEMFAKRHIDGEVRKGKRSGAFCASWLSGKSAWILLSFNGKLGDVYTLAHENGHAVHDYLMARNQKPSNAEIGACIAECGSIFGELLLTERLLAKAKTKEEKQAVLATVLDEFGMAAFQVSARVFFEQSLYDTIQSGGVLDGETVAKLWCKARDRIYGDAVEWLEVMKWEWTMKPHYYIPRFRFYNYPYVFAQLFVFALYRLYKEQGKEFVPKFKALLAAGSSRAPRELAAELGFDIASEEFWQKGMDQAREFVELLRETIE
ncbi:MAG: M3 family oligoendopeptidase [Candidatus Thorarchaeota archaeon]